MMGDTIDELTDLLASDAPTDEKYVGFKKLKRKLAAKGDVKDASAVAASIGHKKYGKKRFQKAAAKSAS